MLEPRSIAVVGASERPGSFGDRLTPRSCAAPVAAEVHLVHPKYDRVHGRACVPSLADLPEPVDLVLLGVPTRCSSTSSDWRPSAAMAAR